MVENAPEGRPNKYRRKYPDIPAHLRRALCDVAKLKKAGEPIPDEIRKMANEYQRWVNNGGRKPDGRGKPLRYPNIPGEFRNAFNEIHKLKKAGEPIPDEIRKMASEYGRWVRNGGLRPPEQSPKPEPQYPRSAHLEFLRLRRQGMPPGDIPEDVQRGHAEYLGTTTKYTKCVDTHTKGGKGCLKRHGYSSRAIRYGEGVGVCTTCRVSYTGIADDVHWCGCCGRQLRRKRRHK